MTDASVVTKAPAEMSPEEAVAGLVLLTTCRQFRVTQWVKTSAASVGLVFCCEALWLMAQHGWHSIGWHGSGQENVPGTEKEDVAMKGFTADPTPRNFFHIAPKNIFIPKGNSSSNHQFSGAMLNFRGVSLTSQVSNIFTPTWGDAPIGLIFFQLAWWKNHNHQLERFISS